MGSDQPSAYDEDLLDTLELIGEGVRSAVYVLDDDRALKAYYRDVPPSWAEYEARLTNAAHHAGAAAPGRARAVTVGSRVGLVMDRIHGVSLWTRIESATPVDLAEFGRVVAQAQLDLAEVPPTLALPHQWDRIDAKLQRAVAWFGELAPALELLGERSARSSDLVCHGDLHLRNVLATANGPVLVDWFDASRGELTIEVARTLVMFDAETVHVDRVRAVRASYLSEILGRTSITGEKIKPWLAVQWAARIGEGLDHDRVPEVRAMIDATI